jgi:hypothetical protein
VVVIVVARYFSHIIPDVPFVNSSYPPIKFNSKERSVRLSILQAKAHISNKHVSA